MRIFAIDTASGLRPAGLAMKQVVVDRVAKTITSQWRFHLNWFQRLTGLRFTKISDIGFQTWCFVDGVWKFTKQRVSVGDGQFPGQFPWSILRFSLKTAEEFCQQRAHTEEGTWRPCDPGGETGRSEGNFWWGLEIVMGVTLNSWIVYGGYLQD